MALSLAACADGYPAKPAADAGGQAVDRIAQLRRLLAGEGSQVRSLSRPGPCTLEVRWRDGPARSYDLLRLDTVADTDPASGMFTVALQAPGAAPSPLLLVSSNWAAMLAVRSAVNQLRAECALDRPAPG